jgi:DNA-binding NtrC family response regulator
MKMGTLLCRYGYSRMEKAEDQTTILLIEDEGIVRLGTTAILEDAGYRVLEAVNVAEASDLLRAHPEIGLVVTDVQMPGEIDGLGLVESMNRDYPEIPTLVTSGRASVNEARQSGADKFLAKPYSARDLESVVQATLSSQ